MRARLIVNVERTNSIFDVNTASYSVIFKGRLYRRRSSFISLRMIKKMNINSILWKYTLVGGIKDTIFIESME